MPVTGPLVTRRRIVLVGLETTRGTPVVPTLALSLADAKMEDATPYVESKPAGGFAGNAPGSLGEYIGTLTGKAYLFGNGNAVTPRLDPALEAVLLACGTQVSGTGALTPLTSPSSQQTVTAYCYQDGKLKVLSGVSGDFGLEGVVGRAVEIPLNMQGVWVDPTDVELPVSSLPAVLPPRLAGSAFLLDAWAPRFGKLSLKMGNKVVPREDCTPDAGVLHYLVADRNVQLEIDAEAVLASEHNAFAAFKAGTLMAMGVTVGSALGNSFVIAAPKVQYRKVGEGDRNGIAVEPLTGQCCFDAGDDEISITPVLPT